MALEGLEQRIVRLDNELLYYLGKEDKNIKDGDFKKAYINYIKASACREERDYLFKIKMKGL